MAVCGVLDRVREEFWELELVRSSVRTFCKNILELHASDKDFWIKEDTEDLKKERESVRDAILKVAHPQIFWPEKEENCEDLMFLLKTLLKTPNGIYTKGFEQIWPTFSFYV